MEDREGPAVGAPPLSRADALEAEVQLDDGRDPSRRCALDSVRPTGWLAADRPTRPRGVCRAHCRHIASLDPSIAAPIAEGCGSRCVQRAETRKTHSRRAGEIRIIQLQPATCRDRNSATAASDLTVEQPSTEHWLAGWPAASITRHTGIRAWTSVCRTQSISLRTKRTKRTERTKRTKRSSIDPSAGAWMRYATGRTNERTTTACAARRVSRLETRASSRLPPVSSVRWIGLPPVSSHDGFFHGIADGARRGWMWGGKDGAQCLACICMLQRINTSSLPAVQQSVIVMLPTVDTGLMTPIHCLSAGVSRLPSGSRSRCSCLHVYVYAHWQCPVHMLHAINIQIPTPAVPSMHVACHKYATCQASVLGAPGRHIISAERDDHNMPGQCCGLDATAPPCKTYCW